VLVSDAAIRALQLQDDLLGGLDLLNDSTKKNAQE
jgi:hypothetical protein